MISLDGKVAIVTGSSRGIGKAIAIELAKKGVSIVLNGRNLSRLEQATDGFYIFLGMNFCLEVYY
mgnify:CR=1 FL=1